MKLEQWAAVALAVTLSGCSTIAVRAQAAPDANLGSYHTYAFFEGPSVAPQTLVEQDIRASLQRNLAARGLTLATQGPPDFYVAYHTQLQQKVSATDYGYGYWGGWGPDFYTYTQGTLILDFIDPRTNKVFWHGTATSVVSHPENPDANKIDAAVAKLLKQYPPPAPMATE